MSTKNAKVEERILEAMRQQEPLPPVEHELGGGIYYTCYWLSCGETLYKWMNYCPKCGNKIDWGCQDDFFK